MIVACVGRRDLSHSQRSYLESYGSWLAEQGHSLTSGNAPGADQAFHLGFSMVDIHCERSELYIPWPNFEARQLLPGQKCWLAAQATDRHREIARAAHPAFDNMRPAVQNLMIRNAMIVMRYDAPVNQVTAFPNSDKRGWGGTGHAIRVAAMVGVPVLLLHQQRWWDPSEGTN